MNSFTISQRVTVGFTAVIAITIGLGIFAVVHLGSIRIAATRIVQDSLPGNLLVSLLPFDLKESKELLRQHVLSDSEGVRAEISGQITTNLTENASHFTDYEKTVSQADGRARLSVLRASRKAYLECFNEILSLSSKGDSQAALQKFMRELNPLYNRYLEAAGQQLQFNKSSGEAAGVGIIRTVNNTRLGTWIGLAVATALAVVIALGLILNVGRSLRTLTTSLAEGAQLIDRVSGQLTGNSQILAASASEQAASLEETSASLEEMTSMVKRNTENAERTQNLANETNALSNASTQKIGEMRAAMNSIQEASNVVSKIIKTIDEIAFQTNLLALNAAVEAARAGEAGAGFAVVADEVRNLAQRSTAAAKETAEKIAMAQTRSQEGVRITVDFSDNLVAMVQKIRAVNELVTEVATASKEQTQGIEQINTAVIEMDKGTQSDAAGAEQIASVAEELNAQAVELKAVVGELIQLVEGASARTAGGGAGGSQPIPPPRAGASRVKITVLDKRPGNPVREKSDPAPPANRVARETPVLLTTGSAIRKAKDGEIHMHEDFKDF
ncbi:MAG: MCP four helix bundle domain-containing protein [Verrucomicrobia bacterium]|nr:MCP four helix bundle domain-containing protein [Verrucomicrobiota bacterium]